VNCRFNAVRFLHISPPQQKKNRAFAYVREIILSPFLCQENLAGFAGFFSCATPGNTVYSVSTTSGIDIYGGLSCISKPRTYVLLKA